MSKSRIKSKIKKCGHCGKEFNPWRSSTKFCSLECARLGANYFKQTINVRKQQLWQTKEFLVERYAQRTVSINQLSKEIGHDAGAITRWLKFHGIAIKPKSIVQSGKNNPYYGKKHNDVTKAKMKGPRPSIAGEKNHNWNGGGTLYYGPNWKRIRVEISERDGYQCQRCLSKDNYGAKLMDVHHIIPRRKFTNYKEANQLDNLICLCSKCHKYIEWRNYNTLYSIKYDK